MGGTTSSGADNNFEVACSFLGWGDLAPTRRQGVWFVGVEEGGPGFCWTQEIIDKRRGQQFIDWNAEPGLGPIDRWISKILCGVISGEAGGNWRRYMGEVLGQTDGVRLTELFPLGKPKTSDWPDVYKQLFGFGRDEWKAYKKATYEKRFPRIRARWSDCRPQATICFGKEYWDDFRCLFHLGQRPDIDRICVYTEQRIVLSPFFGRPMRNKTAEAIVTQLKDWDVRLP